MRVTRDTSEIPSCAQETVTVVAVFETGISFLTMLPSSRLRPTERLLIAPEALASVMEKRIGGQVAGDAVGASVGAGLKDIAKERKSESRLIRAGRSANANRSREDPRALIP
jgi:hypothetical protein